jgi:mRNA interferase YafQ
MAKKDKSATLPRTFDLAKAFRKDWERLSRSGRYDMGQLKEAMLLLIANDAPLPPEWRDHALKGEWAGTENATSAGISC